MKDFRYYLAAIAAFVTWGFFSFVLKPLAGFASLDILFYRVFVSAILMLLVSFVIRRSTLKANKSIYGSMSVAERRGVLFQMAGGGVFLTINWFSFIYVLNHISIKASAFAYMVCPIVTTVLAFFILKENLRKIQWLSVLLSTIGCSILAFNHLVDLLYSLVIAVSYAAYLVSQKKNYGVDRFLLLTLQVTLSALLLLCCFPFLHGPVPTLPLFYILITVIAVFFTIIPLFFNLYALRRLTSSTVGILLYINPVVSFICAITYYHEAVDKQQLLAYGVIVAAVVLFNWRFADKSSPVADRA